jgi:hypothetical protein
MLLEPSRNGSIRKDLYLVCSRCNVNLSEIHGTMGNGVNGLYVQCIV